MTVTIYPDCHLSMAFKDLRHLWEMGNSIPDRTRGEQHALLLLARILDRRNYRDHHVKDTITSWQENPFS